MPTHRMGIVRAGRGVIHAVT